MPRSLIQYGRHQIDQSDIDSVVDVLKNRSLTQGEAVPRFEQALCQYTSAEYCTVTTNATSALHIALLAIGIEQGDGVWTTPISFVASANCALYCGATIGFVDIDPLTRNLCPAQLAEKLSLAKRHKMLPKALIVVHLAGFPCDLQALAELCQHYGVTLIEDASHALGARYQNKPIGSCHWSAMTIFSFHPVKMITTGEGGAITTNNPAYKAKLDLLRSHGITKSRDEHYQKDQPDFYYEQQSLGFNYRMTDIQAALGISQLKRLEDFIATREKLASEYHRLLDKSALQLPRLPPTVLSPGDYRSSWHLYIINVAPHNRGKQGDQDEARRNALYQHLKSKGILCNLHYLPIHLQPHYRALGFQSGDFPLAERYAKTGLTLPLHGKLTEDDCQRITGEIVRFLQ